MEKLVWHTEQRVVDQLMPYGENPRQMTEKGASDLKKSLEKFNLVEIPAIDTDNTICAGHMRLRTLQLLGRGNEQIDVRVPNRKLTKEEFQEYNIRSNKNTGGWNYDLLANFDKDLLVDWGFEKLELQKEFDLRMSISEDEAPEPPKEAKSKLGDVFELGNHRLICGDATKKEDVDVLMDGQKADLLFTDPPYGVDLGAKNRFLNSFQRAGRNLTDIANDMLGKDELFDFLVIAFRLANDNMADDASFYVTAPQGGELGLMMMMMMMMSAGLPSRHVLNWVKNSPTFSMGRLDYDYQHEPILYGWKDKHIFYGGGKFTKSVWMIDKPRANKEHPTMKPIELMANAISNSTKDDQNVLDMFGGSGSTLIACEQLNRKCFMMEIEPRYIDVIIERWEKFTNKKAVKLNN